MEKNVATKKHRGLLIASVIFLVLSLLSFSAFSLLVSAVCAVGSNPDENASAEEAVGEAVGITFALLLLFSMEFLAGAASLITSAVGTVLSGLLLSRTEDGRRVYAIVATVIEALAAVGTVVLFVLSVTL